jgi:hypothetical protein
LWDRRSLTFRSSAHSSWRRGGTVSHDSGLLRRQPHSLEVSLNSFSAGLVSETGGVVGTARRRISPSRGRSRSAGERSRGRGTAAGSGRGQRGHGTDRDRPCARRLAGPAYLLGYGCRGRPTHAWRRDHRGPTLRNRDRPGRSDVASGREPTTGRIVRLDVASWMRRRGRPWLWRLSDPRTSAPWPGTGWLHGTHLVR